MSARVISSGCLVTRRAENEVLLVHARGASFRRPLFGIPKGLVDEGETPQETAVRETLEETGVAVRVRAPLGSVIQKGGRKQVYAFWATVAPGGEAAIDEKGKCRGGDGENDVCGFYPLENAYGMMIPAQCAFLDRLKEIVGGA